ncbi:MAG: adenylate/guanylate cyclase domain-containing protein [Paracoccaceae bacterium]|nr:adenylate/guanylate cyclase domain-containing protein [Paracoccaceae bacterium]
MERRLAAILAADVVGYSRLMGQDEAGTLERLKSLHKDIVKPAITTRKGRVVKLMGDGLLAEFPSVVEAVECAIDIQRAMPGREPNLVENNRILLRIGVNLGDIIVEGGDIFGDGVNVAARLEGLAEPGGVCVSGGAFDAIDGKIEAHFEDIGPQAIKNIAKPVRAYRLGIGAEARALPLPGSDGLALPDKPSVAVLPFANLSGDREQDYFADGITEEIITTLSKVSGLFVIARNSTLVYKDRAVDIRQVGREQGVQYVLEGSVRSAGQRLRVTAQLIEASTGRHLWAQRYDHEARDILALQDDVTKEIVSALQVELTAGEHARLAAQGTRNTDAWQLTFEGRDLVHEHHKDTVQKGRALLERAARLDENYAMAWGALAEAYWKEARNEGWSASPERSFELSIEASDRALAIDPEDASNLAMRSVIMTTLRDFDGALAVAEKALRLAHSDAYAIALAAITLYACGKAEEAVKQTELAMRLCPRYPPWYLLMLARCRWMLGEGEEAIAAARSTIEADPLLAHPYVVLAMVHAEAGEISEAREAVRNILRIDPKFSAGAYLRGLPLRDPAQQERRRAALRTAGLPD